MDYLQQELICAGGSEDNYVRLNAAKALGGFSRSVFKHILNSEQLDQIVLALIRMSKDPIMEIGLAAKDSLKKFIDRQQ